MSLLHLLSPLVQALPANTPQSPKQALLAQLADAVAPTPISFWPLAFGWWVIITLAVICVGLATYAIFNKIKQNYYRKTAIKNLMQIQAYYKQHNNIQLALEQITTLTKQVCLTCDPNNKSDYAGLSGKHWWLNLNTYMKAPLEFEGIPFESLYQAEPTLTHNQLTTLFAHTKTWIKQHNTKYSQLNLIKQGVQHV